MSGASGTGPVLPVDLDPILFQSYSGGKPATVVVAEGVPPVSYCLVEKIRWWEFINMADLFKE